MAVAAIHPGEHLADELAAMNLSAVSLARELGVPVKDVVDLLSGQRAMEESMALRLAQFLGGSAVYWLNLQNVYDLRAKGYGPSNISGA